MPRKTHLYSMFNAASRRALRRGRARMATAEEYARWVMGHLRDPENRQVVFSKELSVGKIHLLTRSAFLPEAYGEGALNVIVPRHVEAMGEVFGDTRIFLMRDFSREGNPAPIVIYRDTAVELGRLNCPPEYFRPLRRRASPGHSRRQRLGE